MKRFVSVAEELERFWQHVDKTPGHGPQGECWLWLLSYRKDGYGQWLDREIKRVVGAHRYAWRALYGVYTTLHTLHRCDYPPCVRPSHLFEGTQRDNVQDMYRKNRQNNIGRTPGERHPGARFSDAMIPQLLERLNAGERRADLAREYHVDYNTIERIHKRVSYKHVRGPVVLPMTGKTYCVRGHAYTEANTYRRATGHRNCRACHRESARRHPKKLPPWREKGEDHGGRL
jgi:HNH endonuclease